MKVDVVSAGVVESHPVVSEGEWTKARQELLVREKALTREIDAVSALRRALPYVKVEKDYVFETTEGRQSLGEMFGGNSQLIVYHFMFGPGWEEGCEGCSFLADHIDGANLHLAHHDVSVVVVSRGDLADLQAYRERMGWKFKWVSSAGSDFNFDYHASYRREDLDRGDVFHNFKMQKLNGEEQPGTSVFYRDENGDVYHTYSSYERGGDILIGTNNFLDLAPKGRNEDHIMEWMHRHDEYEEVGK